MAIIFKAVFMSPTALLIGVALFCVSPVSAASSSQHNNTVTKSASIVQNFYGWGSGRDNPILKHLSQMAKKLKHLDRKVSILTGKPASMCTKAAKNCADLYKCGQKKNGVYKIDPDGKGAFDVFCDQTTAGGGWTVFQKRLDGSVNFYWGWTEYKNGFGNLKGESWLGLDRIYRLTHQQHYKLRVDLEDWNRKRVYAVYSLFGVANEGNKYKLSLGSYSGTAGDSLSYHRGMAFSTKDRDNDRYSDNCAVVCRGAWWYKSCYSSNLNGLYLHGGNDGKGTVWYNWRKSFYSVKRADMKIRPLNFIPS